MKLNINLESELEKMINENTDESYLVFDNMVTFKNIKFNNDIMIDNILELLDNSNINNIIFADCNFYCHKIISSKSKNISIYFNNCDIYRVNIIGKFKIVKFSECTGVTLKFDSLKCKGLVVSDSNISHFDILGSSNINSLIADSSFFSYNYMNFSKLKRLFISNCSFINTNIYMSEKVLNNNSKKIAIIQSSFINNHKIESDIHINEDDLNVYNNTQINFISITAPTNKSDRKVFLYVPELESYFVDFYSGKLKKVKKELVRVYADKPKELNEICKMLNILQTLAKGEY